MAATESRRVVLLAREGLACQRLHQALRDIGIDAIVRIDPLQADVAMLRAQAPDVVLVALEAAIEDRLDELEAVLADPSITVIFDDAELAASREGWNAQRWTRHLSAKVHGHGNVLPPGMEADGASVPPPVPVVSEAAAEDGRIAGAPTPGWEQAEDLPPPLAYDAAPAGTVFATLPDEPPAAGISLEWEPAGHETPVPAEDGIGGFVPVLPEVEETGIVEVEPESVSPPTESGAEAGGTVEFSFGELSLVDEAAMFAAEPPKATAAPVFDFSHLSLEDIEPVQAPDAGDAGDAGYAGLAAIEPSGDEFPAPSEVIPDPDPEPEPEPVPAPGPADGVPGWVPPARGFEVENLEDLLATALPPPLPPEIPPAAPAPALELVQGAAAPVASAGVAASGALLLFAGIGGPDAVRKVLAELPSRFPHPVLLYLRLDGGRYDNLVKQMERVSPMPVRLAAAGQAAGPAQVYVVPDDVSVVQGGDGQLQFGAGSVDVPALLAQMPARRTSVLLLSGASPAHVEPALALSRAGGYVAGQSPQGAYDAAASRVLMTHGGIIGTPAELAAGVIEHSY